MRRLAESRASPRGAVKTHCKLQRPASACAVRHSRLATTTRAACFALIGTTSRTHMLPPTGTVIGNSVRPVSSPSCLCSIVVVPTHSANRACFRTRSRHNGGSARLSTCQSSISRISILLLGHKPGEDRPSDRSTRGRASEPECRYAEHCTCAIARRTQRRERH